MFSSTPRRVRRPLAGLTALGLAAAAAVGTPTAAVAAAAAGHGSKTPAIGADPHYQIAGQVSSSPDAVTFTCQLTTPAGCYQPAQIRAAYGVDKLNATGKGQSIIIVDAFQSPTIANDLAVFNQLFELPDAPLGIFAPDGLTPFDENDGNMVGWAGEITLDVEWAHAIAPEARINLVLAKSNDDRDILSATRFAIEHNLGNIISQSFGESEECMDSALINEQAKLFRQASAKHITLLASSGDQGAALPTCDGTSFAKAASSPASDPSVTAVGGTRLDANGLTGAYNGESVWNEPPSASGGGFSKIYGTPDYQRSLRLPSRGIPDIAYNGATNGGVLTVWSSSGLGENLVFRFGGTSAGSPQWAGLTALANQLAGHPIGALNTQLYSLARGRNAGTMFNDVIVGDNTFHGPVTVDGFPAGPGWDASTGLGTPRADTLIPRLAHH